MSPHPGASLILQLLINLVPLYLPLQHCSGLRFNDLNVLLQDHRGGHLYIDGSLQRGYCLGGVTEGLRFHPFVVLPLHLSEGASDPSK